MVCALMQGDSSSEMFARPPKGQEREGFLGFEHHRYEEPERKAFAVKRNAKYVDKCLDLVHLQNAKPVVTPLTEHKSANSREETTVCDQAEHALFSAVIDKLQCITGVKSDLLFVTKCLSYELASPTLPVSARAKKTLRCFDGTRHLNLYLTILAMNPKDLFK